MSHVEGLGADDHVGSPDTAGKRRSLNPARIGDAQYWALEWQYPVGRRNFPLRDDHASEDPKRCVGVGECTCSNQPVGPGDRIIVSEHHDITLDRMQGAVEGPILPRLWLEQISKRQPCAC